MADSMSPSNWYSEPVLIMTGMLSATDRWPAHKRGHREGGREGDEEANVCSRIEETQLAMLETLLVNDKLGKYTCIF